VTPSPGLTFRARLDRLIEEHGGAERVSRRTGIDRRRLLRLASGAIRHARLDEVARLADAYDRDRAELAWGRS
jgi:hypothetical protein